MTTRRLETEDPVAIRLPNGAPFVATYLGVMKAGAVSYGTPRRSGQSRNCSTPAGRRAPLRASATPTVASRRTPTAVSGLFPTIPPVAEHVSAYRASIPTREVEDRPPEE